MMRVHDPECLAEFDSGDVPCSCALLRMRPANAAAWEPSSSLSIAIVVSNWDRCEERLDLRIEVTEPSDSTWLGSSHSNNSSVVGRCG